MTQEQELKIVENCQSGQMEQFSLLYDEYVNKIYRFLFYRIQHKETSEDLTSVVFLKALENIKKFDFKKGLFSVWIYRIARNTAIDHLRTKKETVNIEDIFDLSIDELKIEDRVDLELKIKDVRAYMEKLTPEQKELITMRVWDGLSYREIAGITGKTENSLKTMFSRTMKDLRTDFGPMALIFLFLSM